MEDKDGVYTGKSVDEAILEGLVALGITRDEAEIEVIEEGKKKLFGSVKAKVRVTKKRSDGERAAKFIEELLKKMQVEAVAEASLDEETVKINITTPTSARVIGKRGDILDAIQVMASAYANIGNEEYKKVVVDCENYREQREETLKALANKLAKKAVETGRKMKLEPMTPYERRIIHSALIENTEVKTVSEGREPARYIVVIPHNAKPGDRGVHFGEKRRGREDNRRGGRRDGRKFEGRNGGRREGGARPSGGGAKRGKKQIYLGTFLGNSNEAKPAEQTEDNGNEE